MIIVSNTEDHRGLLSQGFSASAVSRIDDGFDQSALRTTENRVEARRALTAINGDFHAPPSEPVALCVTQMAHDSGIQVLIESARHLIARYPKLHLWFIGDGPRRESIFQYLRGEGIRTSIAMPGSFGTMEDVFRAADVFVHTDDTGMQSFLPAAVSAELPIVAVDNQQTRARLYSESMSDLRPTTNAEHTQTNGELVHWFQNSSPKSFRKAMRSAMDDLAASQDKAVALKRNLVRARSFSDTIDDYARVIDQVQHGRLTQPHGPPSGAVS